MNQFIAYPIALEQELMEGSYRALWDASFNVPFPEYRFFVDFLVDAARDNIAECAEKAYRGLSVDDAIKLLKLADAKALNEFCTKRGWEIKDKRIHFHPPVDQTFYIPAQDLIKQGLGYATELERIV
jgi:26S proteasome regulatory subunit N12